MQEKYAGDIAVIMSKIHQNGGNYWATEDMGIGKGSPFSTRDVALMLHELGFAPTDDIMQHLADLIFHHWRPDGRFQIAPGSSIYPCHTIGAARVLCYLGHIADQRIEHTLEHLFSIQQDDGGWKCNKYSYGRGPETAHSNPGPTLEALDVFRHSRYLNTDDRLDRAVGFLLWHWEYRKPVGPCQFGMGSLFTQTEFPFFRYNLFYYCYVLSFYQKARRDTRYQQALELLQNKVVDGQMVVENPNRQLAHLEFCRKGAPSEPASRRYREMMENIKKT